MTIAERIYQQSRELPEAQAQSVRLRRNKARQQEAADMSEFDQFGAVYDGTFDRNACYDRPVQQQHGQLVDSSLTIVNPFAEDTA
jgi:predicted nucleic acid-binding protein